MSIWHIYGGNRLTGSTRVQGAKNAVLPIMAASVLSGGETVLHNVPDLRDVTTTLRILQHLGCTAVRDGDTVRIDSRGRRYGGSSSASSSFIVQFPTAGSGIRTKPVFRE